jgi:hypothetical protein
MHAMDTTPAWIPLATAAAALIGGGVGAALQGTFSVHSWRRQTRLEAYTKFIAAEHEFNSSLRAALTSDDMSYSERRNAVGETARRLSQASSLVKIAGPASIDEAASKVIYWTTSISYDLKHDVGMERIIQDFKNPKQYNNLNDWMKAANGFAHISRRVLKTDR